jgi:FkbH-like protein
MAESPRTESPQQQLRPIAISATFTSEPIRESLEFWIKELGLDYRVDFAPYNQVFQSLLDPGSLLSKNDTGVNVLLIRIEDWAGADRNDSAAIRRVEENVTQLVSALQASTAAARVPTLICLCPCSPGFLAQNGCESLKQRMDDLIRSGTRDLPGVHVLSTEMLNYFYPVADYYDATADQLGHVPYTSTFFTALGTLIVRRVFAMRSTPYKVIALDCDNTLWHGICGEDGPENVVIDDQRRALQDFMVAQREAGMILAMCSRNNEADVLETFRAHPEMPLKIEHFVTWRINWDPKSANLASLAEELDLGLDSFVFIDDDLKECAEVEANCPDVLTLGLTEMGGDFAHYLRQVWAFDHWRITEEDRKRSEMYAEQVERSRFEKTVVNLEDFISGLKLQVNISAMSPEQLPRVAQLTQRTNQMNFTAIRRSEAEIDSLVRSGTLECQAVDVSDRFGSYGLVGVVLYAPVFEALRIDTFVLSCRALGRGVEHRVLAHLAQLAGNRGLAFVEAPFTPSARNQPALAFLKSITFAQELATDSGSDFRLPVGDLVRLTYHPSVAAVSAVAAAERAPGKKKTNRTYSEFGRIAANLADASQIEQQIRSAKPEPRHTSAAVAPRTDLERKLAAIWSELLNVPHVGVHDNFFDLGGHSLLAVQLLSRVRQEFGIDLSLEVVYSGTLTVAELAKAIELYEFGHIDSSQYADLLAELEGLSDEEVAALLAHEQETAGGASHHPE